MEMSRISFDEIMKEREKAKRNGTYKSSIHSENTQNKGLSFEEVLKKTGQRVNTTRSETVKNCRLNR